MNESIVFIGAGNMARSLIGGLIASGWSPAAIRAADPSPDQLQQLLQHCPGIHTTTDNDEAASHAEAVVLAVKPQALHEVATGIAPIVQRRQPLIVSIAAGVRAGDIERWLGGNLPLVRCMPNTPALVSSGATGLYANARASAAQRGLAETLLRAVGLTVWLDDEAQLDAVTALSGSGPAYFFLVMEAMEEAAVALGLPHDTARLLTIETAFGAAKLALESRDDPALLRTRVTSRGGTTERALAVFEEGELKALFERALTAARDRSRELADVLGAS
ncbi:MAG: pyrroline-5-carboxylate reductase [Chromatiales bacterium]|jgi:pyrroline-5-carboxylate reductase|nr:pyrroline-5-carboxylate reductase [Chromatiales bacterium]MDX9767425.1 pyrroline-5-carboxylate reductase [Ectothiorhodospiraceae bacterium]